MPHLEIPEIVIVHCKTVNNDYQQDSRALYTFVLDKWFDRLLGISAKNFIFLKTFKSEFSYIDVWIPDQSSRHLEIEGKINYNIKILLN